MFRAGPLDCLSGVATKSQVVQAVVIYVAASNRKVLSSHLLPPALPASAYAVVLQVHRSMAMQGYDAVKSDVWALGVMLCVLLLGKFPFEGQEASDRTNDPLCEVSPPQDPGPVVLCCYPPPMPRCLEPIPPMSALCSVRTLGPPCKCSIM